MRLFVALVPPEAALDPIRRVVERKRGYLPKARWVRGERLHLTLAFLGEVDPARVGSLAAALIERVAEMPSFRARLAAAGAFPPAGRVRVVWAGFEPAAELAALAAAVRRAVGEAGLVCDDKPFRPHLTLARCPEPWRPEARAELESLLAGAGEVGFEVDCVALVESVLGPGGPTYTTRAEARLGTPA